MSLRKTIEQEMVKAMKAKEKVRLQALRSIKALILNEETKEAGGSELSEEQEMALLKKAAKQRRDSLETYQAQNREDLAETEKAELEVIEEFLPSQLSDQELKAKLQELIAATGAQSPKDMGKLMGEAQKHLAGQADNKRIADMAKSLLGA